METSVFMIVIAVLVLGVNCLRDLQKNELTIGLILNVKDDLTRKVASMAVEIANTELSEINLSLQIKTETIEENASFHAVRKACNLLKNGLVAIISPMEGTASRHISSLCSKFHIPHLVTRCRFPESMEVYPMDIQMSPDCNEYANIIYQYITKVENWKNMIIIHSYSDCILKFESLVTQFEMPLKMRQWYHNDLKKNKELMRELSKSKIYHSYLVDIPYWQIKEFLIMASVHNMTEPQYSFIFTDWDASNSEISAFKINNRVNITVFSIINQTAVEHIKRSSANVVGLIKSMSDMEMAHKNLELQSKFLAQPAIIFDSINLLAKGLTYLAKSRELFVKPLDCMMNGTWDLGASLTNAMASIENLYGLTGKISFNYKIQRKDYNISIMELTENGFEKSAFWDEEKVVTIPKPIPPPSQENVTLTNPLRVTTKIEKPFVFYGDPNVHENYDTHPSAWRGYCIDLLERIGSDLNLNFSIHVVADNLYGISLPNETMPDGKEKWSGMIGELLTNKADLVVAPMTITYEREKVVDFTTPFMSLGLSILFLKPKKEAPNLFSFLSPLSAPVWVCVIGAYVVVSLFLFVISHITPYECLHSHDCEIEIRKKNQFRLLNSLWFSVGALVRQGCDLAPQASSTRILVGAWWFFTLIIISTYTANLAAFLTVEQLILPIKSAEDLANQTVIKYGTMSGGASYAFFNKALIPTYQKMYKFMQANPDVLQDTVDAGIQKVLNSDGKYAFLMESSWIDYYVQIHCSLIRVGDLLDSKGYGIGLPEGSPLRDRMSVSILKLQKEQVLDTLKHRWWNEMNLTEPCNDKEQGKIPEPLKVSQVGGVFALLAVGLIVGALVSVLELYVRYSIRRSQFSISFSKFFSKELKFAMRFMSSSKKLKKQDLVSRENKEELCVFQNPRGRESDEAARVNLVRPLERSANGINFSNRPQLFLDLDNTDVDQDEFVDSLLDGMPGVKYPWGLENHY